MGPNRRDLPVRGDAGRCQKETEETLEPLQSERRPRGEAVEKEGEEEDMLGLGSVPARGSRSQVVGGGSGDEDAMFRAGSRRGHRRRLVPGTERFLVGLLAS